MKINRNKQLALVTGNKGKAAEVAAITGWNVDPVKIDIREIQSLDVEEVAREKALAAYAILQRPVIVDDTGMTIYALNGLPGALVSWFLDTLGPEGVLKLVSTATDRRASVSTCIGYADESGAKTFLGAVEGELSTSVRGTNGFGYDPIFMPSGHQKTYAEMTAEQKNEISMRKLALFKLRDFLQQTSSV